MYKFVIDYIDKDGQYKTYVTHADNDKKATDNFLMSSWSRGYMSVIEIKKVGEKI